MASKGRTKGSRKESVVFKVEQMEWPSKEYYIHGTSIPEKMRCHGCGCVSNTIYPLDNECQGHGLCRDCKESDFACHHHGGNITADALRNAVGQTNKAAKKLTIRCSFCESEEGFLNFKDHMHNKHPELLPITLKSSETTAYEQEKPASTQEKHQTSSLTWREDNFSQNANVTVESEDNEAPACKHCQEEWDARELGEHEKACPKKEVQCPDCEEWITQEELGDHKKPASAQEKHRTSSLTWREDHFSQNADVTVESEDDEASACKHCKEEWDARELGEHEKACPKKEVQCRYCDEWIKQEQLCDHKKNCKFGKCDFCYKIMKKEEMTTHEDICEKIPCCYRENGCHKEGKKKNIKYHQENDSHALFFLQKIKELQERIQQLEPPIRAILKRFEPPT